MQYVRGYFTNLFHADWPHSETEETLSTGQQCERLEYPGVICDRLLASLKESTTLLPSASRVFGQYQSGFIRRL